MLCTGDGTFVVDRLGIDLEEFKNVKEVYQNLVEVEAFVKADPKNQPDFK